jgi:phage replication-related protein YjqB (UPF0714/DUF867 family)
MADRYSSMQALFAATCEGRDYRIHRRAGNSDVAVLAPHGGVIEPGTFEIANEIAGSRHGFYCFEAITESLHVTSTHFDDETCLRLVKASGYVLAIHGCRDNGATGEPDLTVAIGGLDKVLGNAIRQELEANGFAIGHRSDLMGVDPRNICNRSRRGIGVQLEIARSLRDKLMKTRADGGLFSTFAAAINRAIQKQIRTH